MPEPPGHATRHGMHLRHFAGGADAVGVIGHRTAFATPKSWVLRTTTAHADGSFIRLLYCISLLLHVSLLYVWSQGRSFPASCVRPSQLNPRALEAFDGPYDLWEEAAKESLELLLDADNHPMILLDR